MRRVGLGGLVLSGVWLGVAVVLLGVAVADEGRDGRGHGHGHEHGNGVLLLMALVGVPVLTWIGAHLVVAGCLWRGQRWARVGAIVAFGISGLLPLWLFPLHPVGFVNAVLCAVVVTLCFQAVRR